MPNYKSTMPIMTGNIDDITGIRISSVGSTLGNGPGWKLFDGVFGNSWANGWETSQGVSRGSVTIDFSENRYMIKRYDLYPYSVDTPTDWILQASNDNKIWDILHTVTNNRKHSQWLEYEFKNRKKYRYYMIKMTGNKKTNLQEMQLYVDLDDYLIPFETIDIYKNIYINKNYKIPYKISNIQDKQEQLQHINTLEMPEGKMFTIPISEVKKYSNFKINDLIIE